MSDLLTPKGLVYHKYSIKPPPGTCSFEACLREGLLERGVGGGGGA